MDRVSGAFFHAGAGTNSGSDSKTDSDPELESPSVDFLKSDSNFSTSVGGGESFWVGAGGVGLGEAGTSLVPMVDRS